MWKALLLLTGLLTLPVMATANVPMPSTIVLIVCKTIESGPPDQNSPFTKSENREWATEHSMMVCRRHEMPMYDMAEEKGATPQPFNVQRCQRSAMLLGPQWDSMHRSSPYRFWRAACPTPIFNADGEIVGWTLPDCGHRDTVICEKDTVI